MNTPRPVPPPGAHGGDVVAVAASLGVDPDHLLDLSVTLNPHAPDVTALLARHFDTVLRYPDASHGERLLADAMGVDPNRLVLTNGGSEAIALVAAEHPTGWVDEPDFSLYRRHLTLEPGAPRWRSNPHNPTGALSPPDATAAVWDEAFWPLTTGTWTRGDADRGSIVVGSLTKLFACPGLRLGYVLAPDPDLATRLRQRRPEWSVGSLALAVLPELLDRTDLPTWSRQLAHGRHDLVSMLVGHGLAVSAHDAPWVLVSGAADLREQLARQGVLVRDCASFGLAGTVRIAVPSPTGLDRLATALDRSQGRSP